MDQEEERTCRYCHEPGTFTRPLISPCQCIGSVASVHSHCLARWVSSRAPIYGHARASLAEHGTTPGPLTCELCGAPYATRRSPAWSVVVHGLRSIVVDLCCSHKFHSALMLVSYILLMHNQLGYTDDDICCLPNILAAAMIFASFCTFTCLCYSESSSYLQLSLSQQHKLRHIKNVSFPVFGAILTVSLAIQTPLIQFLSKPRVYDPSLYYGCALYAVLLLASVLFASIFRMGPNDDGLQGCRSISRTCLANAREAYQCTSCTPGMCIFGEHIYIGQLMFQLVQPSNFCFDMDLDLAFGLLWSVFLLTVMLRIILAGGRARRHFEPRDSRARFQAHLLWVAICANQIMLLSAKFDTHRRLLATGIYALVWSLHALLLFAIYFAIYLPHWAKYGKRLYKMLSNAFRSRVEFCSSHAMGGEHARNSDQHQPLLSA